MAYIRSSAVAFDTADVTSITGVLPPDYEAGDMLVWIVFKDATPGGDPSTPSGWSVHAAGHLQIFVTRCTVFYKANVSASETAPQTTSTNANSWYTTMLAIAEYDTTTEFGAYSTVDSGANNNEYTIPALTTTSAQNLVIWGLASNGGDGGSMYGGSALIDVGEVNNINNLCYWDVQPATGSTGTRVHRQSVARRTLGLLFSIRPSATSDVETAMVRGGTFDGYIEGFELSSVETEIGSPTITTVNGLTTAAGASQTKVTTAGLAPAQRSLRFTAGFTASTIHGVEYDTSVSPIDFSTTDKYFVAHVGGTSATDYQLWLGTESETGVVITLSTGTTTPPWRAWHVYAKSTGKLGLYPFDNGIVINPNSTAALLDSSGTFDNTDITSMHYFAHAVAGSAQFILSRLFTMEPWKLLNGSSRDPARMATIYDYQLGEFTFVIRRQGANQWLVPAIIQIGDSGTTTTYAAENGTAIEFGSASSSDDLSYSIDDNDFGLIFATGSGDTVDWDNVTVSSATRYRWQMTGTGATCTFNNVVITRAGDIDLISTATFTNCTWTSCGMIVLGSATFDTVAINNSIDNEALQIASTTEASNLSDLTFSNNNSAGSGHSIEITAAGTYTADNWTFTGGGVAERTFHTTDDVNSGTDIVTCDAAHGYSDGDQIYYSDEGGVVTMGLTDQTLYYVNAQTTTTLSFHTSEANAIADTSRVNLTASGAETHSIYSAKADLYNSSSGAVTYNVINSGGTPTVRNSAGSSTTVNNNVTITLTNLIAGSRVYIENTTDTVVLFNEIEATTTFSDTVNYTADKTLVVRVRNASGGTKYKPFSTGGTLTSSGFTAQVNQELDE